MDFFEGLVGPFLDVLYATSSVFADTRTDYYVRGLGRPECYFHIWIKWCFSVASLQCRTQVRA